MGKSARLANRPQARAAKAEAMRRAERRRQWLPVWIGGGVVVVGAVIVLLLLGSFGKGAGQLPASTKTFAENNHQHVTGTVRYDRTPPAGGAHSATWLNCGVYDQRVPNANAVHSLEHGSIWITYRPTLSLNAINQLQQFVESHYDGTQRYLVLSPYPGLPAPVVASAWGAQLRLTGPGDPGLAAFVAHYIGGNQGGEQGAPCTGGTGSPIG